MLKKEEKKTEKSVLMERCLNEEADGIENDN
jgi:hypothetical protein